MMIDRLTLIGVGLIGGSLARALKTNNACREVVGSGRNVANLIKAVELGVIDRYEESPGKAVVGADLVVVCVPLGAMASVFQAITPYLSDHTVVTDVGSAKSGVISDIAQVVGEIPHWFVPGHPIAGTEQSGVEASFATLFQHRRVILTPSSVTSSTAISQVKTMWQATGAEVVSMSVQAHDRILAATSHLPHMLAFSLVNQLVDMDDHEQVFRFAAGGFRDFSRIASSDPVMWRDICLGNREAIVTAIKAYQMKLQELLDAIQETQIDVLEQFFLRSKIARDAYIDQAKTNK